MKKKKFQYLSSAKNRNENTFEKNYKEIYKSQLHEISI